MDDVGPRQRALLESSAARLYEEAVHAGALRADDERLAPGGGLGESFDLLCDLGLLARSTDDTWSPVDPTTVQSQVVTPLGQRGSELIAESAEWARAFGGLAQAWRRAPGPAGGPFVELRGDQIEPHIFSLVADAEEELLTAQPQTGRRLRLLTDALEREVALLRRGVRVRTLYQHSARRSTDTRRYVAQVTAAGAQVRTLDEFFNRLIVVDRRVAVIPGTGEGRTALAVREPSVVAYLADIFERSWQRARPFTDQGVDQARVIAAEQRAMTIRMLIEGHADRTSAKRLGVSPRTYAAYVADLKGDLEVETRFQLGYAMGQEGISGDEIHP